MVVLTKTVLTNLQFKRPINMTHSPIRLFTLFLSLTASGAFAEPKVITTSNEFVELVTDNKLTRPFITLKVSSDGEIHGKGAFSKITGAWLWEWNSPLKVAHPLGYIYPYYRRSYEWVANERNQKTLY